MPRRARRRGDLHRLGHRRRAPRAAGAAAAARQRGDRVVHSASSTPRSGTPPPGVGEPVDGCTVDGHGRVHDGDIVQERDRSRRRRGRAPDRQPRGGHAAAGRRAASCRTAYRSSWTPARRWAGCRCPAAGRPPPARRTSGAGRPASACCWSARAPAGATPSPPTTGSTSGSPGFENVPAALGAAAALQAVVAERDEVRRAPARAGRPDPGGGGRDPGHSRWSATRSTGSPTW